MKRHAEDVGAAECAAGGAMPTLSSERVESLSHGQSACEAATGIYGGTSAARMVLLRLWSLEASIRFNRRISS